jgi:hypothetical protein
MQLADYRDDMRKSIADAMKSLGRMDVIDWFVAVI